MLLRSIFTLHCRLLSTSQVSTALRPFYKTVHPDLFGQLPQARVSASFFAWFMLKPFVKDCHMLISLHSFVFNEMCYDDKGQMCKMLANMCKKCSIKAQSPLQLQCSICNVLMFRLHCPTDITANSIQYFFL